MTAFRTITLNGWRQFADVDIDLSKQVTVLTGQNGCGKTTILNILNRHFGWNIQFVSTPYLGKKTAKKLWSDIYGHLPRPDDLDDDSEDENSSGGGETDSGSHVPSNPERKISQEDWIEDLANEPTVVGSIKYDNGQECELTTSTLVSAQYQLGYSAQQSVTGLHIPSHRPATVYHSVDSIPTNPTSVAQVYQQYQGLLFQSYSAANHQNPGMIQKQSLISMMVFGEGNSSVQENQEFVRIVSQFQAILRTIFPPDLGFLRLEIRMPDIVLITRTGTFSLDAMSGGISALFGLAWQIHMYGWDKEACTVTIDEPENHLHPSMQRTLLPNLSKAFPKYRFIIATHSPFIVTSFPDANVYGLLHSTGETVAPQQVNIRSHLLSTRDLAGTPNSVLRDILDVESNLPLWVEKEIGRVLADDSISEKDRARRLLDRLKDLGITDALPDTSD